MSLGMPGPFWIRSLLRLHLGMIEVDANKTLKKKANVWCKSEWIHVIRLAS